MTFRRPSILTLLLLSASAASGYAIHALGAQGNDAATERPVGTQAPAYLIYMRSQTSNLEGYESYSGKVPQTYEGRSYRALVLNGPITSLEGVAPDGVVVVQFPSVEAAKSQYYSAEYQAIAGERQMAAEGPMFIVEGVPESTPPPGN
jgi:uncharacterized protein (DUF1330 family)